MTFLTRRYRFSASHRLHSALLDDAENAELYGKCNNPYGHGHDYVLALTLAGEPDSVSGLIVPLAQLDDFVSEKILRLFAHRNINVDVPQFSQLVPTTENLVRVISALVEESWSDYFSELKIYPWRVHIQETGRNSFELDLRTAKTARVPLMESESVIANV